MKGYVWKCVFQNEYGINDVYAVSETSAITSATPLSLFGEGYDDVPDFDKPFNVCKEGHRYYLSGVTETSEMDASRVDYNKRSGNEVFLDYVNSWPNTRIIDMTDDFIPGSQGAKYTFRLVDNNGNEHFETYVIGETVIPAEPDAHPEYIFDGYWGEILDSRTGYDKCYVDFYDLGSGQYVGVRNGKIVVFTTAG